jgi:hypothetical protein
MFGAPTPSPFNLGGGLRRIQHLDSGYAHFVRRLLIVEVNASFRVGARRLDHLAYCYANDAYRGLNATLV